MPPSSFAEAVDGIQRALRPDLRRHRFRGRGRTFNRATSDGLTQVINIQMGASDPPGANHVPELRENLHGLFAVNLGVYVPEVARLHGCRPSPPWIQPSDCCIRARMPKAHSQNGEHWWPARNDDPVVDELRLNIESWGIPFLERFETRDQILSEWSAPFDAMEASSPPRIVHAIILAGRGEADRAWHLLCEQVFGARSPGHPAYVRRLAEALGLPPLNH